MRELEISERAPLEGVPRPAWHVAFGAYLTGLGCPLVNDSKPYTATRAPQYAHWLVSYSIGLAFKDDAAGHNAGAEAAVSVSVSGGGGSVTEGGADGGAASGNANSGAAAAVPVPAAAVFKISDLARLCGISAGERPPFALLQAVSRAVRQRLLPASLAATAAASEEADAGGAAAAAAGGERGAERAAAAMTLAAGNVLSSLAAFAGQPALPPGTRRGRRALAAAAAAGQSATLMDTASFPLGFATGDVRLDAAAALLRMLYVADLRELQDAVNDILITVQEFTADPKTDAALGRCGF